MNSEFDIVVLGGGIAGLSAGLTAARQGLSTAVVTGHALGGHLTSIELIEGYPGFEEGVPGYDLCPGVQGQAAEAGAEFSMSEVQSVEADGDKWRVTTPSGDYVARALIVATGTRLRVLGVPGEDKLRGKGVSQCASCDAPLLGGKPVVVVGGGDSAMQEALTLADHCSSVTIVHAGPELGGQLAYRQRIEANSTIKCIAESELVEVLGDEAVTGARVKNASGTSDIEADAVFVFVGLEPISDYLGDLVERDESGHVKTDGSLRTRTKGIFCAGTVRAQAAGRAAAAAGEGAAAALAAAEYLEGGTWTD